MNAKDGASINLLKIKQFQLNENIKQKKKNVWIELKYG